jgi:fumarylacetoacetase
VDGADGSERPLELLPYAVSDDAVVVAIGEHCLDLTAASAAVGSAHAPLFATASLDRLLAAGRPAWDAVRAEISDWLSDPSWQARLEPHLRPLHRQRLRLPFTVADYVDFYASEAHATNLGRLLRPGSPPLMPNWRHLPVGYHGRSGTVVVSGTDIRRPFGQRRATDADDAPRPEFAASDRLDIEAEIGFVVGVGTQPGERVSVDAFTEHVFGLVVVNDWSARDIQAWEAAPLGPFLGKSFATSISPWVVPLAALARARQAAPSAAAALLPYLVEQEPWGLDLTLEVRVNGAVLSRPPFAQMYWSPAQLLAHLTVNGARLRPGDLYASGTVSGWRDDEVGSLFELYRGQRFLADGDCVEISASAAGPAATRLDLGSVAGTVLPALSPAAEPPG